MKAKREGGRGVTGLNIAQKLSEVTDKENSNLSQSISGGKRSYSIPCSLSALSSSPERGVADLGGCPGSQNKKRRHKKGKVDDDVPPSSENPLAGSISKDEVGNVGSSQGRRSLEVAKRANPFMMLLNNEDAFFSVLSFFVHPNAFRSPSEVRLDEGWLERSDSSISSTTVINIVPSVASLLISPQSGSGPGIGGFGLRPASGGMSGGGSHRSVVSARRSNLEDIASLFRVSKVFRDKMGEKRLWGKMWDR